MAQNDYKHLRGIFNTQDATLSNMILENMITFYDWGFLDKGAFYNISIPESGMYGGDKHKLRPVKDPNYSDGQVWEGYRSNWVWETGVSIETEPTRISGVFVNDETFRATGNIEQPYYIDYPDGRVVFDSAISTNSTVHLEYAHKWVDVIPAEGVPWFREIQQGSMRVDNPTFLQFGSGDWAQLGQTRVQLPALAVEVIPPKSFVGFQLGGGQLVHNDILFYIMTENHWECANIMDQVSFQNDRTLWLFDTNKVAISGVYPLDYRGEVNENALPSGLYPHLVDDHRYRRCWLHNTSAQGITQISPDLYVGTVRCTTEVKAI
jgi:hypothetical protein